MEDIVDYIFKYMVAPATVVGTTGYFIKAIFKITLEKDLEKYKQKLSEETLAFQHQLNLEQQRNESTYNSILPNRLQAIKELNTKISESYSALSYQVTIAQGPGWVDDIERYNQFMFKWQEMLNKYYEFRIYLPDHLDKLIYSFVEKTKATSINFDVFRDCRKRNFPIEENWSSIFNEVQEGHRRLVDELVSEMKQVLGTKSK